MTGRRNAAPDSREPTCEGKHRFDSYRIAANVNRARNQGKHRGRTVYACPFCAGFHIGTPRKSGRQHKKS